MTRATPRTSIRLAIVGFIAGVVGPLCFATRSSAQTKRPPVVSGAPVSTPVRPPPLPPEAATFFDKPEWMTVGPDGKPHLDGKKVLLPKFDPSTGDVEKDATGKPKLYPLDDGSLPPIAPPENPGPPPKR